MKKAEFVTNKDRIDWYNFEEPKNILKRELAKNKSYVDISKQSVELFSTHVSAKALWHAAQRYLTPVKKSTPKPKSRLLGLTRFDYEQMVSGTKIRVNGDVLEIQLP